SADWGEEEFFMGFFYQSILDSLIDQIAVLDSRGYILTVNQSWLDFALENDGDLSNCGIGANYLEVCPETIKLGIIQVLQGKQDIFDYEYPCHSDKEIRWFMLRVTPVKEEGICKAVVSHVNIT